MEQQLRMAQHRPALSSGAAQAAALFNEGNAFFRAGRWETALKSLDAALALSPALEPAALQRARCLAALQRHAQARDAFAEVLRLNPSQYNAWLEAGHLCRRTGEMQQALAAYRRAIDTDPQRHEALLAMARVLEETGDTGLAEQAGVQAAQAAARQSIHTVVQVYRLLGRYRLENGEAARALLSLRKAMTCAVKAGADANDIAALQVDIGEILLRLGSRKEAFNTLTAASQGTGEATLDRLAEVSFRNNLCEEALAVTRRNLALHPDSAQARGKLAHLLAACGNMGEAERLLHSTGPTAPLSMTGLLRANLASRRGNAAGALAIYRELATQPGAGHDAASRAAMSALYCDNLKAEEIADLHHSLFKSLGNDARNARSFRRPPLAGRRLKLGIVSADFHYQHPVTIFMQPLLRELDRSRFEVFVYFTGASVDGETRLAQSRSAHWCEAAALNDLQLARHIDADGIDLLLDLAGHSGHQRVRLFAQRAAPVQATYLGYPCSTGVPNIDWLLGDAVVTPPGCEYLYTERVARLPGTVFCYAPEEDYPLPRFEEDQAGRPLVFGSFNNTSKLGERTLRLWGRILDAVPGSLLLLRAPGLDDAHAVQVFRERLQRLGIDAERVHFQGPIGLPDMMASYADIDIGLDPLTYNGGTTTLQALWMGVPVVTLAGDYFASRMGASFMQAAGMDDWVAHSEARYVGIAAAKAADRAALLQLKQSLRARLQQRPAWDVLRHTRAFENALQAMAETAVR